MKSRRIFITMVCLLMCLASYSSYGDLQPRFPDGEEALMAFIEKEIIVSKMPRWKPAKMLNGRTAEHWWTIAINFDFTPIG